jgi:CRP-like cAMP-binding protein
LVAETDKLMGRRTALGHLAHLVCEIYCKLEVLGLAPELEFLFPATQTDLADMLGLSAVHVSRSLQELRAKGLIQWRGHAVKILDWDGLQETAEFDPTYLHHRREPR